MVGKLEYPEETHTIHTVYTVYIYEFYFILHLFIITLHQQKNPISLSCTLVLITTKHKPIV